LTANAHERQEATTIVSRTIGEAWLAVAHEIMAVGRESAYDALAIREILMATLSVNEPNGRDDLILRYAEPARLAWMHENFVNHRRVQELGDADSYATRLRDYDHSGRDQIAWVSDRLLADPLSRSATISTFQPLTDTNYIPCVSLLDFFLDGGHLHQVVYAHSIDFGAKGYANLVELATLQHEVACNVDVPVGSLTMIVKSAHIYATDFAYMDGVLTATR
jgi:thymidylate synthase